MPSLGIAPGPGGCRGSLLSPRPDWRRFRASFRRVQHFSPSGDWDSGNPAFAISRGSSRSTVPNAWTRSPVCWRALVPLTFRIRVSHQTQEPPSEFLPATPGIRPRASWRTERVKFSHDLDRIPSSVVNCFARRAFLRVRWATSLCVRRRCRGGQRLSSGTFQRWWFWLGSIRGAWAISRNWDWYKSRGAGLQIFRRVVLGCIRRGCCCGIQW